MKKLALKIADAAVFDVLEQANWYKNQSGEDLAIRWERAVTSTLLRILRTPRIGTPCRFKSDELHDVRRVPVARFNKHLIFYRVRQSEFLVLRVVHGARDLEKLF